MLYFRNNPLPKPAETFLSELVASARSRNTVALYKAAFHHFYRFLLQQRITISGFDEKMLNEFDLDLERHNLKLVTRKAHIGHVHVYLRWLESKGEIQSGLSKKLFPKYKADAVKGQRAELPPLAARFLEVLSATKKKNTVNGYQTTLRSFYNLHQLRTNWAYEITRTDVEDFMIHLKNRNMGPNERLHKHIHLKGYLAWLYDHKKLKAPVESLITSADMPRREERLPKPFPVDVDIEIQKRLDDNGSIDYLGVLLMRRCGLRVGELRNLTQDCIINDLNKNWFLKVPLGKLNNERIIPLDPKTVEVVKRIQAFHPGKPEPGSEIKYLVSNKFGRRRSQSHFGTVLQEVTRNLAIPGGTNLHRLRHSFATSLLSAGISITTLKDLMGHRDIRMTLMYAAVTQETIRNEYFTALSKIHSKYEVAAYPLKTPDLRVGMNRGFYDAQKYAKKIAKDRTNINKIAFNRLCYRLMTLRNEFCQMLALEE